MKYRDCLLQVFGLQCIILALIGCGPAQDTATPTRAALAGPTQDASTPTRSALTAPTLISARGDKEWDYVVIGDSTQMDVYPRYGAFLRQDLGVTIAVHDWTAMDQDSSQLLQRLRTDQSLRQDLRDAEVITFIVPTHVFQDPALTLQSDDPARCGGVDHEDCLRNALKVFEADTDGIYAELASLRPPSTALLRTMDQYLMEAGPMKAHGLFDVVSKYWGQAMDHVRQVASKYEIPVAPVYAEFMGPNRDQDPREKGLLVDGRHPSADGAARIAESLRALGYEFASER